MDTRKKANAVTQLVDSDRTTDGSLTKIPPLGPGRRRTHEFGRHFHLHGRILRRAGDAFWGINTFQGPWWYGSDAHTIYHQEMMAYRGISPRSVEYDSVDDEATLSGENWPI